MKNVNIKNYITVIFSFIILIPLYSQAEYVLHVSAEWMAPFNTEIKYTGDYSGTGTASFDIGPYSESFTVTLTVLNVEESALAANLRFICRDLDYGTDSGLSVTAGVDNAHPDINAVALYANVEPTPPAAADYGYVWLDPLDKTVVISQAFTCEVHVNSGARLLAAYGIIIS